MNKLWYFGGLLTFIVAAVVVIGAVNASDNKNLPATEKSSTPTVQTKSCGCQVKSQCGGTCQANNCQCGSSCAMNQAK
ncbi:MAG TPA: hypothetical protein PKZ16_03350 [bacterium]|nr:hypothetical protein [bacterium]HPL95379.1 hypothetical protein [bacterium]